MTPNILEGMKFPFNVGDYVWLDVPPLGDPGAEAAVVAKAKELGLPELFVDAALPKDLPMPFEKVALVRKGMKGSVLVTTYERDKEHNEMTVAARTVHIPYLAWFKHHGNIEPPALNLQHSFAAGLLEKMRRQIEEETGKEWNEAAIRRDFLNGMKALYWHMLLLLMERKQTVSAYTPIPNPTNEKRIRKGKRPIFEWKVIDVTAARVQPEGHAPTGKTHASPRRHVRRGHQRRYKNGKVVWIREMMVGKIEFGYIHHSYTSNLTKGEQ